MSAMILDMVDSTIDELNVLHSGVGRWYDRLYCPDENGAWYCSEYVE